MVLRQVGLAAVIAVATAATARAEVPVLRISTENVADHVQTEAVARFAEVLAQRAAGRLEVRHYPAAELYRDRDVIKALELGKVEMAVPGTWQLDRYAPDFGIFLLPMFYGRGAETNHVLRDGPIGREIAGRLERALDVKVLGRWIDLGFAHVYGVARPIAGYDDLHGLVVRVPGGEANLRRLRALGAEARVVAWPDLPTALARRAVTGILSTHETVVSARLWEQGVTSAFEDSEYFPQYVPLVSAKLWHSLPADLQDLIMGTWEELVMPARALAAEAQESARATLKAHGIGITTPTAAALAAARQQLMTQQEQLIPALGIDPALARDVAAQLPP
jgi:C4-dicarboxylate-binding protein DctP